MYCNNCGKEMQGEFCSSCGFKAKVSNQSQHNEQKTLVSNDRVVVEKKLSWFQQGVENQRLLQVAEKERIREMDRQGIAYCPKCKSASLSANKKGFGIGKAVLGTVIGPLGLMAGNIGAKKVRVTCLKCGHQFMAGKK